MWMDEPLPKTEILRQGDLISDLLLPRLAFPLPYARGQDMSPAEGQPIVLTANKSAYYLVTSQCCTIEQKSVCALARLSKVSARTSEQLDALALEEPDGNADVKYSFASHPLKPISGVLNESIGIAHVADFLTIQTYSGALEDLQARRVASMTPEGRRLLRIRLSLFWGRAEREDEEYLLSQGLPVGARGIA